MSTREWFMTQSNRFRFTYPSSLRKYWKSLESSSVQKRLLTGTFWNSVGGLGVRLLGLATSVLLARLLGKEGFGEYGMVISTLGMFGPLANLQQTSTASVFIAEHRDRDKILTGQIIRLMFFFTLAASTLTALAVYFFAGALARVLNNPGLTAVIQCSGALVFFTALNGIFNAILSGFEDFKRQAYYNLLSGVVSLPLVVAGAHVWGLFGVMAGLVLSQVLLTVLYYRDLDRLAAQKGINLFEKDLPKNWGRLLNFSLVNLASNLVISPAAWISGAILVRQPGGYSEMGLYQVGLQWHTAILQFPGIIAAIALPVMANSLGKPKHFADTVKYNLVSCFFVSLAAAGLVALFAPVILYFYGPSFKGAFLVLFLMAGAGISRSVLTSLTQVLLSTNRVWSNFWIYTLWTVLIIGLSYLWVPGHLAAGMASASLTSFTVVMVVGGAVVWRAMPELKAGK